MFTVEYSRIWTLWAGLQNRLIGTEKRLEYTAISDTVNTAKRLQENSANNQILISKQAYERVKDDILVKPHADMTVKGKSQVMHVFEVLGLK